MKKDMLNMVEKLSRKVAVNSFDSASFFMCYEEKMDKELKDMIMSKRVNDISKIRE